MLVADIDGFCRVDVHLTCGANFDGDCGADVDGICGADVDGNCGADVVSGKSIRFLKILNQELARSSAVFFEL